MEVSRSGQLFEVQYDSTEAMSPEQQAALIQEIRDASRAGPVALLFMVGEGARVIDPRVPGFWLDRVRDPELRIESMAIVSRRLAVRIAANSFKSASKVLGLGLRVQAFEDETEARSWLAGKP